MSATATLCGLRFVRRAPGLYEASSPRGLVTVRKHVLSNGAVALHGWTAAVDGCEMFHQWTWRAAAAAAAIHATTCAQCGGSGRCYPRSYAFSRQSLACRDCGGTGRRRP